MDYFSLNGLSGDLSTAKQIDRESLTNNNGIVTLVVRVSIYLYNIYYIFTFIMFLIFIILCFINLGP